jgi:hypothetical protein
MIGGVLVDLFVLARSCAGSIQLRIPKMRAVFQAAVFEAAHRQASRWHRESKAAEKDFVTPAHRHCNVPFLIHRVE